MATVWQALAMATCSFHCHEQPPLPETPFLHGTQCHYMAVRAATYICHDYFMTYAWHLHGNNMVSHVSMLIPPP